MSRPYTLGFENRGGLSIRIRRIVLYGQQCITVLLIGNERTDRIRCETPTDQGADYGLPLEKVKISFKK